MKSFQLLGGAVLLGATVFLSSCEKDRTTNNPQKTITNPNDTTNNEDASQVLVVNALGQDGQVVDLLINGNQVVNDLGLGEVTQYLDLDNGQAKVDLVSQDGAILASSNVDLLAQKFYNIVIGVGPDGITPAITVLGIDLTNFDGASSFAELLKLGNGGDLSGINFLDLTKGLPTDNLLMGADFLDQLGTTVPGILELPEGDFSDPIFGSEDILKNLTMLNSAVPFEDLLKQLQEGGTGLPGGSSPDISQLEDFFAILESGNTDGILTFVQDLITQLLGGNTNPLTPLSSGLLDPTKLEPGHDYTGILTGTPNNPVLTLIDQTVAGLPQQP